MTVQAVIFDMDGLIFDTETLAVKACQYAGKQQGLDVTEEVILETLGKTDESSDQIYKQHYPTYQPAQFWADFHHWMMEETSSKPPRLMPFAMELLEELTKRGIKRGLCSASPMVRIERYMSSYRMLPMFDAVVCGDSGAASKPAPDMYLLAAKKLNIVPENCMVLEDSPNGLRAGHAAGMQVYMVPDLIPYQEAYAGLVHGVLDNLSMVLPLLDA